MNVKIATLVAESEYDRLTLAEARSSGMKDASTGVRASDPVSSSDVAKRSLSTRPDRVYAAWVVAAAGLVACLLLAGCSLLPLPAPTPAVTCEEPPVVDAVRLECDDAVREALAVLGPAHPPIRSIEFVYGPCPCPENMVCDCALHAVGTVTFRFEGAAAPVTVAVAIGRAPLIVR
jgi:hypothetical protein